MITADSMLALEHDNRIRLVAFDLDGTLLRGDTVCLAIARRLGHLNRMIEIEQLQNLDEIAAAREELAVYYQATTHDELLSHLEECVLAPGVRQGFSLLQSHEIAIAIVSITWSFGVEWFARQLNADYWVGTGLSTTGIVSHFWPNDKPVWLYHLMSTLDLTPDQVAAVGDSSGDVGMLEAVQHGFFVGASMPDDLSPNVQHIPNGDIYAIAQEIVAVT